jgi:L-seryl-tRNA(Ser) seleniumtransferase
VTERDLPSVAALAERLRPVFIDQIRKTLNEARRQIRNGAIPESIEATVETSLETLFTPSLRCVINATGVVLHTNLGRAPLAPFRHPGGYSNLEYDLSTGKRGRRDIHASRLLEAILGRPALVVNNNAAALLLVVNELASDGEVIVSRGELIEIGEGFRIAEIVTRAGGALREVGATNKTHLRDYAGAINERTRLIARVHPSNFRMTGFTSRPMLSELVKLGRARGIPVYEDLGSGALVDLGIGEPLAQDSLRAGADLISFSGDKLLGGPQAGIVAGRPELVARCRRNPLFRALRKDKIFYECFETTLRHILSGELDRIPAFRMIRMSADEIRARAERLLPRIPGARLEPGESVIGGGSTPEFKLPTWLIVTVADEARLRSADPPVVARVAEGKTAIDLRTVLPEQEEAVVRALRQDPPVND